MDEMKNQRKLTRCEKGEISNLMYNYSRAETQKRKAYLREILFDFLETLLNAE